MFSGIFIAEEVEVGVKGPGDTTTVDIKTHLGFFEHVPEICLFN